ncbi:retrovirus-related pol polyprotein from transposon TNT 1-94 [Tanacetum coccineum]
MDTLIRFQDLIQQAPHHGVNKWLLVQIFYDNISPDDRNGIDHFAQYRFSQLNKDERWNRIEEYVHYQDNAWEEPAPMNNSFISENDDIPPWGNIRQRKKGEEGFEWVVRSKLEDIFTNFMLEKYIHAKGLGEMLNQQRNEMHDQLSQILAAFEKSTTPKPDALTFAITTRSGTTTHDPLYPTPSNGNDISITNEEEEPKGEETTTIPNKETPQSSTLYHPSKSSSSDSGEEDDQKANDETCLVAQASSEICLGVELEPDEWTKDSGCSKHMTSNQKLFSTYKAYNRGQICDNKCRVTLFEHDSEITKDGKVTGRGIRKKGLYVMKLGNKPKDKIYLAMIDENSTLWHRRLGHANMHLIQSLASKEVVRHLPKLKFDQHFCDACKIGKQALSSHKAKNVVSTTICLELLHMVLFDPSAVRSYRENLYTFVIVDDYSRAILGKTPSELLRGRKPTLDYFRVFRKKCFILNTKDYLTKFDPKLYEGVFLGYSQNSKAYIILNKHTMKIEESLNVTFDETPPPSKTIPLVDDDLDEEEIDNVVNIKESMNHPLENVIGNLNQRTLRSQA